MDLKQLQTFLLLSRLNNFTKTAEQLHYAQSNVTAQIKQLETELGVKLFERLGRSISLTEKGKALVPYASQMLLLSSEAKERLAQIDNGKITIAASESLCIYRLPSILKAFRVRHPEIELYLQMIDTSDFVPFLAENTVDAAYTLDIPVIHPSIQTITQKDEVIGAFALPSHPFASYSTLTACDFEGEALILTGKDCCYRKQFEHGLAASGVKPNIVLETSSIQVIKETALSGLGICILPVMAVEAELKTKQLIRLPYETDCHIVSQLIYHKDKWISPALRFFFELIREGT